MMKSKVLILIPNLRGGGTERTVVNLVRNFDYKRTDVKLLLISREGPLLDLVDPKMVIAPLDNLSTKNGIIQFVYFLTIVIPFQLRFLKEFQPSVIMTCTEWMNDYGIFFCKFRNKKTIWVTRSGQNTLANSNAKWLISPFLNLLTHLAHRTADGVIVPCQGLKNQFINKFRVNKNRIYSIFNPIELESIVEKIHERVELPEHPYIIGIGRLEKQKRFDLLIRAFLESNLPSKGFQLLILGIGSQERKLKTLAKNLDVDERISFKGFEHNPYPYLSNAKSFVLTSDWEGFAHVVAEALVCQTKVISANCPFGPSEILENGTYGSLFKPGDKEELIAHLNQLKSDESNLEHPEIERFKAKLIAKSYLDTFELIRKNV